MPDEAQKPSQENSKPPAPGKVEPRKADEDPVGKVYDSRLIRRLGHYLRPYWWQAAISSISISLKSLSDVAGPYLVMVGIDRYFPTQTKDGLPTSLLAPRRWNVESALAPSSFRSRAGHHAARTHLPCALVSAYLFEFIQTYLMQWTGQKIMFDLRRDIFRHMQRMHVGFFDTHAVGRLVTRLTSDVDAINEMFTGGVLAIVDDFFTLTIMAIVMLSINWWLALLAFAVLPLILIVTRLFRNSVRESYRRVRAAIARINSFTQEHISGMSVVQLFNREQRAFKDFEAVNRLHMIAFKDTIFAYALYYPAVEILSSIAIALVIWRGGFGVLSGSVTIGMLAMFNMYSQRFWRPIQDLSDKYNILQAAMAACERIFKLLDTAPEIVSPAHPRLGDGSNRIEFRHVWFTYQKLTPGAEAAVDRAPHRAECERRIGRAHRHRVDSEGCLVHRRARPDRRHRRPHGRRQNHAHQPDDALLRRDRRRRFFSTALTCASRISPRCAATSPSFCRTRSSSPEQSPKISASATKPSPRLDCGRLRATSTCSTSSRRFPTALTSPCRNAATRFPPARSSSSISPAPSPTIRASSSSTKPLQASIPTPSCASVAPSSAWSKAGPAC